MRKFSQWEVIHDMATLVGMTSTAAEPGLRERKKAATRQALHEAAFRLAIENGPEHVTVEAIADEVGVSRRTFSNYFANKEEALLYGDHLRMHGLIELVRGRPAAESAWTALTRAAEEFYPHLGDLDPGWVAQGQLLRSHPALVTAQVRTFAAVERELAAEVAVRLPQADPSGVRAEADPSGVRAQLTAATFLSAIRVSVRVWLERPQGPALPALVGEALAQAGRGFE
jgi:AcrR family transcriptional regulator